MIGNYTGQKGELNFQKDFQELLLQVGWQEVIKNPTHEDLKNNLKNIINENNIEKLGINTLLTDNEFNQIMDKINTDCTTPVAANVFINGKQICIKSEIKRRNYQIGDNIYLDMFNPIEIAGGKSRYQIVEQPIFETSSQYNDRRGDILLLINGLPLIEIELKASGHSIEEGTNQIQKYMNEGVYKGLFSLIQVFFVATPEDIIYFANSYPKLNPSFMFHWGDKKNKQINNWQELILGENQILSIPEAHQLIGYYTTASIEKDSNGCIENINNGILMVARSYQINAIKEILKRVKNQTWGIHNPLGGYIWGTTGCGKTLTSYKAAQLVVDNNYVDKVVFVVDRVELSDQSYNEYLSFARDGEPIRKAKNTYELYKLLLNENDKLLITSIQKLSRINEEKSKYVDNKDIIKINNKRILFLPDEAHRSQFGEMHERIKNTFVNALFIGFTGTPIFSENNKEDGLTSDVVFGDCLAVYSIASGIRDKNVLGFDPKMIKTYKDNELKDGIACNKANVKSVEEAKNDKEKWRIYQKFYNLPMIEIEKLLPKSQYNTLEHRKAVVEDVLSNWDSLSNSGGNTKFHALLATDSIKEAIEYYRMFKNTKLKVTTLFDANLNGNNEFVIEKEKALIEIIDDYNNLFGTDKIINREADPTLKIFKKDVTNRLAHKGPYKYIKEEDIIDIVIVVDQLLTGFDSKYVNTLYLDKVLDTDGLIQAISRTNRVLTFEEKPWGIFRYYRKPYTMEQNILEALRLYCEGGEDSGAIVGKIDENLNKANNLYKQIETIFSNAKITNFDSLPKMDADCQKFKQLFKELSLTISGMKLQGMNWGKDNDEYVLKLSVCKKWIDNNQRIYDILYKRYKDLFPARNQSQEISINKNAFDIMASLSEVEKDKIDADYLEEHFKLVIPILVSDIEDMEKEKVIKEFSIQLSTLSIEQQKIANNIIDDIKNGILNVNDRKLKELIIEYQIAEKDKEITNFANKYGINIKMLKKSCNKTGNHDMEIAIMRDTCDVDKVMKELNCNKLNAKANIVSKIKEFLEKWGRR